MIDISLGATDCPNLCRHCWIYGGSTRQRERFPADVLWEILGGLGKHKDECFGLGLGNEETYHPHLIEFYERVNKTPNFQMSWAIPTNGWGIARDPDIAFRMKELGIKHLRFTFYGKEPNHDWFACRSGAYADLVAAANTAKSAGIRVGWNIILHKGNLHELPDIMTMIDERGEKLNPSVMEPTGRGSEIQHLALEMSDFDVLPEEIKRKCRPSDMKCQACLQSPCFVLAPNLDVHFGTFMSGTLGTSAWSRLGNLKNESILEITAKLENNECYQLLTSISVQELAEVYALPGDEHVACCYLHRKRLEQHLNEKGISTDFLKT